MRLAPLDLHTQLQPFEAIKPIHALLADPPAFALEHHQHAQIPEPRAAHRDVADTLAKYALVACLALGVPNRRLQQCEAARAPYADLEALLYPRLPARAA